MQPWDESSQSVSFARLGFFFRSACMSTSDINFSVPGQRANLLMVQTNFEVPFGLWETNEGASSNGIIHKPNLAVHCSN